MSEKKKRRLILQDSDSDDPPPSPPKAPPAAEQNGEGAEAAVALEEPESVEKTATLSSGNGASPVEAAVPQVVKTATLSPEPLSDDAGAKAEGEGMPLISDGLDNANSSVSAAVEAAIPILQEELKADNNGNNAVVAVVEAEVPGSNPAVVEPAVPQEQVKAEDSEMGLSSDPSQNGSNSNLAVVEVAPPQEVRTGPLRNEDSTVAVAVPEVIVEDEKTVAVQQREEASADKLKGEVDAKYNKEEGKKVAVFKRREELRIDKKKSAEDSAEKGKLVFERRREVKPESGKQREDAGGFKEKLLEDKKSSGEKRDTGKVREEAGILRKKIVEDKSSSAEKRDTGKVREEAGTLRKKILEDKKRSEEKRDIGKERVARQDSGKQREENIAFKKKYEEYKRKSLEGNSDKVVEAEKSNSGNQRESSTFKLKAEEEIKVDKKKLVRPAKNTKEAPSFMKKALERSTRVEEPKVSTKIEFKDGRKRPLSPNSVKRSEELHSAKKKVLEFKTKEEFILARKRAAMVDIGEKRDGAVSGKKKVTEPNVDKGADKKKSAVSDDVNKRELAGLNKKKTTEPSGSKSGGKRRREASESDADISLKRIKNELNSWEVETKKADGKKMKLATKSVASSDEETDDLNEKSSLAKLRKTFMPKAEKDKGTDSSGKKTLQNSKDDYVQSVGIKKAESDVTRKNKLPELKVHIRSEDGENSENSSSSSPSSSNCSTPVHPDGSTDELVVEKRDFTGSLDKFQDTNNSLREKHKSTESKRKLRSSSAVLKAKSPGPKRKLRTSAETKNKPSESKRKLRTSSPEPNKSIDEKHKSQDSRISSPEPNSSEDEKHKSSESKRKLRSSSAEVKKKVLSSKKPGSGRKGAGNSSLKTPLSMKRPKNSTEGRASVKRQITDKIKAVLLSSGWRIDLRPRRGRNYEDQVYIPPTGGSGYWSITKAYAAFQNQSSAAGDVKSNNLPGKSSNKSVGNDNKPDEVGCSSSIIPAELLSMLKRNVVNKRRNKISKDYTDTKGNTRQKRRGLLVRGSNQEAETGDDGYVPYVWKRTVLSWMIDVGVVPLNGKVNYMNKRQTRSLLDGLVVREGIQCNCCSKVITVSKFEVHAGSKLQQPYENIFVEESGMSLLQCQQKAWEKQDKSERQGFCTVDIEGDDPNDDACGVCGNGGDLICCDGCPSTFHQSCLGIEILPLGSWHCTYCSCRYCGLVSKASDEGTEFSDSPLLSCNQCEKKYHQGCIPEEDVISTISNNLKDSFCGKSCRKVFRRLQKLLGIKNDLEGGLSWRLIRRLDEEDTRLPSSEVSTRAECNAKIAIALAVMDECFLPIIDQTSNINLIHNVVYNCGSNFNRLNYSGFYTFTLEREDEVICVASVRIHGTRLAEMPFIGTRNMYRRQGMCKRLLDKIESALRSLGIRKLIIPAISELKDTWTTVFGFKPLSISAKEDVRSMNILVFPDTGLLEKLLLKKSSSQPADKDVKIDPTIKQDDTFKMEDKASVFSSVGPILHPSDEGIVHPEDDVKDINCRSPAVDCCDPSLFNVVPKSLEQKSTENAAASESSTQHVAVCHDEPVGSVDFAHDKEDLKIEDNVLLKSHAVDDTSVQHTSEVNCPSRAATVSTLPDCGLKTSPILPCSDATLSRLNSDSHCISSDVSTSTLPDSGGNDLSNPVSSLESIADSTYQNPSDEGAEVAAVKVKPNADAEDAEPHECGTPDGSFHVASNGTYACNVITKPVCAALGEAHQVSELEKPLQQNSETVTESSELHVLEHNEHNFVLGDADKGPRGNAPAVPYSFGISALNGDHSVMGICEFGGLCQNSDAAPAKTPSTYVCSKSVMVHHDFKGDDELTAKPLEPNDSCSEDTPGIGTSKDESACMHTTHALGLNSSYCSPEVVTASMGEGEDALCGERGG